MALPVERKEPSFPLPEKTPIVERPTVPEAPHEIEGVEAVAGGEISLPTSVTDTGGQPLVSPTEPQQVTIQLPLDNQQLTAGLKVKANESWCWLSEWARRLLKIMAGKFIYKLRKDESN